MPLASVEDVRRWISEDKLPVDTADIASFQIEVERTIKAMLSGIFTPAQLQVWADSATTPDLIQSIAGKLIAAYVYREAYSEDQASIPEYAQELYQEAVNQLTGIRSGALTVLDENYVPVTSTEPLTSLDMYPNDAAEGPKFTMDRRFA